MLLGKLLGGEFVKFGHLAGEDFGSGESFSEKHDFSDEAVVRDHHGDRAEEDFEVVGQFGTAFVAGVHGDKHPHSWIQFD